MAGHGLMDLLTLLDTFSIACRFLSLDGFPLDLATSWSDSEFATAAETSWLSLDLSSVLVRPTLPNGLYQMYMLIHHRRAFFVDYIFFWYGLFQRQH